MSFIHHIAALSAVLLDQANVLNPHGLFGGFRHVVHGQSCNRDRRQRLHLDPGLAGRFGGSGNGHTGKGVIECEVYIHAGERQRMTQRDQLRGPLGTADPRDLGDGQHVTFLDLPGTDQVERLFFHADFPARDGNPFGIGLVTDIHHMGATLLIEMGKLIWHDKIISYAGYNSPPMENLLGRQLNYTVHTSVYEGPLDLLLDLIERAELDITTVSLAAVTDQYLASIKGLEQVNADEISAFLVIAAKLLQIKSEALLPRPPVHAPGEEDLARSLVDQLKLYKRFKEIGGWMNERQQANLRTFLRVAPPPKVEPKLDLSNLTLERLVAAAQEAFAKERNKQPLGVIIAAPRVTIREKIDLIAKTMNEVGHSTFRALLNQGASRLEIVVTFLAMLELVKRYRLEARQESLFSDIEIDRAEDWKEDEEIDIEFE